MKRLYVLYDAECGLCRSVRVWLSQQDVFVPLVLIPLQSPDLERRFPGIRALHPEERLIVVSDVGEVWQDESAWVTVLWALRGFRSWALRFAHPTLRPLAKKFCHAVSGNRRIISTWFGDGSDSTLHRWLAGVPAEKCDNNAGYSKPR